MGALSIKGYLSQRNTLQFERAPRGGNLSFHRKAVHPVFYDILDAVRPDY